MSIIKATRSWLGGFDGMTVLTETTQGVGTYSLAPSGNAVKSVDIMGNRTYQNSYVFLAKENRLNEVDRQDTFDFLESLTAWVEEQADAENYPVLSEPYIVDGIEVSNGMLIDVDDNGEGTYQVQIQIYITKRSK